jgi:hypothetical protein
LIGLTLCVTLLLLMLGLRRIWTVDYWWQWATGRYIVDHGIPRTDVFSYTNFGRPRIELRWGYCLALYAMTSRFGHPSAVIAKTIILLGTYAVAAWTAIERRGASAARLVATAGVVTLAALAASQRFYERPETVSYFLFVVFVAVVDRCRRQASRSMWLLPALQVIWVNSHGLFVLGPAVAGLWWVEASTRRLVDRWRERRAEPDTVASWRRATILLGVLLAASLVNPFFHRAFVLPILQFGVLHGTAQKDFFVEFTSPFVTTENYTALFYYTILILLAAVAWLANARRQSMFWLLLLLSQFYLSATALRNIPLFVLVAVPFVVRNASDAGWLDFAERKGWPRRAVAAVALATALLCLYQSRELYTNRFSLEQGDTNQSGISVARLRYPVEATDFLRRSGATGALFNPPGIGSYLIGQGFKVFIDPRGEEHMERVIGEYRDVIDHPQRFPLYADRYDFRIVVLWTEQISAILSMRERRDWRLVYADPVAVVFFRNDTATDVPELRLDGLEGERWFRSMRNLLGEPVRYADRGIMTRLDNPAPYMSLSNFCLALGQYRFGQILNQWGYEAYPPAFSG